ncbi:MAG: deoxyguanosinetriphosphate triphosphohydrolase [Burkholderiaceae bacterium]|nr:deoxyguanosinetriphosphate triphosphohydrolase [Burkholderiaceae bacterium]
MNTHHGGALAAYASQPESSRGRRHPEPTSPGRNEFQRDRDRIVHSTAFRRLVYKTQVFLNHEGDLFRTRMTHSLEVAQIARSIARPLGLHEDLVEAIALAHDVGHTPFGHAGQDALNDCLHRIQPGREGFEHNFQSLRVIDLLEARYPQFDGLNLTFEAREGVLKHCSQANARRLEAVDPGGVGHRFLTRTQPSLEAQLCNLADEIAYNAHDIDDGVRSGLLSIEQLQAAGVFDRHRIESLRDHPTLPGRRLLFESIRRMLSAQIHDVIDSTRRLLADHAPQSADQARGLPPLVSFSPGMAAGSAELKLFLSRHLYRHPQVQGTTDRAREVVRGLFERYFEEPESLPESATSRAPDPQAPVRQRAREVADYIAGMTDRFALREHERLTGQRLFD